VTDIIDYIIAERQARNEAEVPFMITSLKVDEYTRMQIVQDIKQELRKAQLFTSTTLPGNDWNTFNLYRIEQKRETSSLFFIVLTGTVRNFLTSLDDSARLKFFQLLLKSGRRIIHYIASGIVFREGNYIPYTVKPGKHETSRSNPNAIPACGGAP
jgi:hypothetical protein